VCAVGVPPKEVVDKLHAAKIPVMNMVGHPKHVCIRAIALHLAHGRLQVAKALAVGVDLICAQAGEGGGHTGDIPASILIPACVDECKGHKSPLTGGPVQVVGAGAVYDGRSLAVRCHVRSDYADVNESLGQSCLGCHRRMGAYRSMSFSIELIEPLQVGTRFVASTEAGAPKAHKEAVLSAGYEDAVTTLIYTGRPLRVRRTDYIDDWLVHSLRADLRPLTLVPFLL
jgi:NAD(P)H-dependent flavin oxidoreductase YrpB (nitropropane dioxygenase family)